MFKWLILYTGDSYGMTNPCGIPTLWFGLWKEIIGDLCHGTIEFLPTACQLSKGVTWALPSHALSFIKVWINPSGHSPLPSGLWLLCKTSWSISLLALSASHFLCWFSSLWLICCIVRKLLCWITCYEMFRQRRFY